jgi:ABC-type multidrug transport system fused ATPase/permease subunit
LNILEFLHLGGKTFQEQVSILALAATALLISRTVISLYLSKRTFLYFASKSITLSQRILSDLFKSGIERLQAKSNQDLIYSTTQGCDILMIGVFAQSTVLVSDVALLIVMGLGMAILQPATAILSLLIFGFAGAYMQLVLNKKSKKLGQIGASQAIINNRKLQELFSSYREIYVTQSQGQLIKEIGVLRRISTENQAEINFLPIVNKYFLETTLLIGALSVSAVEFALNDARTAMSGLAIFLAAGSRIAPALLRVQQNLLNIRNSIGGAQPTIDRFKELTLIPSRAGESDKDQKSKNNLPEVTFENVTFRYSNGSTDVIRDISFEIRSGETVAITGPSGSGKTTVVDLMLGILEPASGKIKIDDAEPFSCIENRLFDIAYVPQEVRLISDTLLANIALGVPPERISTSIVLECLAFAQLSDLVNSLPNGLETLIGEEGILLSGGQRQRIGLARALYREPKLLVLDEPTSALDKENEEFIATAIESLKRSATIVIIAHRLNTLKNVDKVLYIDNGQLQAEGTFEEVRKSVTNFDQNAISSGL